jgi:hypothetical protein
MRLERGPPASQARAIVFRRWRRRPARLAARGAARLKTNGFAQVLSREDRPIEGLYAVGTDRASVMGGFYPSGGINLGPA